MADDPKFRVISVFCTKGGVGKTFIAANLAAAFSLHTRRRAAFVEVDHSRGEVEKLVSVAGVHYVPGPHTPERLPESLAALHGRAEVAVIDAGSVMTKLAVTAFEQSNLILLITTPDMTSIRYAQESLELFGTLKLPLRMIGVVINRAESRGNLRSIEVKTHFASPVIAEIPSDGRLASVSVNRVMPIVMLEEPSRIKEAFKRLAMFLAENEWMYVDRVQVDASQLPAAPEPVMTVEPKKPTGLAAINGGADPLGELRLKIQAKMIERFDLKRVDLRAIDDPEKAQQLRDRVKRVALELITEESGALPTMELRERLVKEIVDEALGLGPLEDLMEDPEVSDILVNGKDKIYVERRGKLQRTDKRFSTNDQVLVVIERIVAPLGRRIDESSPMVDARLPDGSRVNAIIPPLSVAGPTLSIRKFSRQRYTMDSLLRFGTLSSGMCEFLKVCVQARKNVIVSGGTGSGKTTLLNALSSYIPENERIVTIEDSAELRLDQEHWVPLEARPPNIEGRGDVTVRALFRNTLRMRPDRIIIGECRSDETLDMLQAMNTGHDGSMTTLHANSPEDVIARLDSLVLMSNVELPVRAVREQIGSAVQVIVHGARLSDGTRKITHIAEIAGITENSDLIVKDIFVFKQQGIGAHGEVLGSFVATGHVPTFLDELVAKGVPLDASKFRADAPV